MRRYPVPVEEPTPKPTAAMLNYALASDAREAFPQYHDDEAAECGFATIHAAELALAEEGA